MMYLFQLGSAKIHLHGQRFSELEHTTENKAVEFINSSRKEWGYKPWQPAIQSQSISGILLGECGVPPRQVFRQLQSMVGMEIPIIGYTDFTCCVDGVGCACAARGCQLVWMETRGILRSVKLTGRENDTLMDISIEIDYRAVWTPLNRVFWQWDFFQPMILNEARSTPSDIYSVMGYYPSCSSIFNSKKCKQWKRIIYSDTMLGYDPDMWLASVSQLPIEYPQIGVAYTWRTAVEPAYRIIAAPSTLDWNYPAQALYAFRNLPTHADAAIRIGISRQKDLWEREDDLVIVDLSDLDDALALAGYIGLDPDDILYIGDLPKLPGFVMRNNAIIPGVRPAVTYTKDFPGFIVPGYNVIDIEAPIGSDFASLHTWRHM